MEALFNSVLLAVVAIANATTAYYMFRQREVSRGNAAKLDDMQTTVNEVHTATNGLQAKLIASTERAAHSEGVEEGRVTELARDKETK